MNTLINLYIPKDMLSTFQSYQHLHTRRCVLSTRTPYNRQHINYSIPEVAYFNSHKTAESKYSQPHGSRRNRIIDQHTYKMRHVDQLANTRTDISIVKPARCTSVSNLFYFGMTLYMFRTVFPSIISSSRLYIQQ